MVRLLTRLPLLAAAAAACLHPREEAGTEGTRIRREAAEEIAPIGTGDRWANGTVPRGLGTSPAGTKVASVMNPEEIRSAFDALAAEFDFEVGEAPNETHEGATMFYAKIGGAGCDASYRTFLSANIHARERASADNLVYFISDLLWAEREGTGVSFGGKRYSKADVERALSTGIVFMPLLNPDGVAHDQAEDNCWRRNRNPDGPVDLNRNFDYLWDYKAKFADRITENFSASDDPTAETYVGTSAFSEPESRNVKWVLDEHPSIEWSFDIHSYAGLIIYSWGEDFNQFTDPDMDFRNSAYDDRRGIVVEETGEYYSAYRAKDLWQADSFVAQRVANAMGAATDHLQGIPIIAIQGILMAPTMGSLSDYVTSRGVSDPSGPATHGLTLEFGQKGPIEDCPFYHGVDEVNFNIQQVGAGLMEFLLGAADEGLADVNCSSHDDDSDSDSDSNSDSNSDSDDDD